MISFIAGFTKTGGKIRILYIKKKMSLKLVLSHCGFHNYRIRFLLICLILAVSCGDLIANTTDIQFMCYEDSRDFGSVCWARCKYGYILRNDKQEDEQEAELSELVDQAQILLDNAMVIK